MTDERTKLKQYARELEARLVGQGVSIDDLRPIVEEYVQTKVAEGLTEFANRIERLDRFHGRWEGGATYLRVYLADGSETVVYPHQTKSGIVWKETK